MRACFEAEGLHADLGNGRAATLSIACPAGAIVRISGSSGSGKTTMLRTIARLNAPAGGVMRLSGDANETVDPVSWRTRVAFIAQRPALLPGTIGDNLSIGFSVKARKGLSCDGEGVEALCETLLLTPSLLRQDASSASGGEAARAALIRALVTEPQVLLLDEITAPLDEEAAAALVRTVSDYVKDGDRCALFVAHQLEPWLEVMTDTTAIGRET